MGCLDSIKSIRKLTFNTIIHNYIECKEEIIQIRLTCCIGAIALLQKFKPLSESDVSDWTKIEFTYRLTKNNTGCQQETQYQHDLMY